LRVFATNEAVDVFYGLTTRALELSWRQSSAELLAAAIMFLQTRASFIPENGRAEC
jgi:hypothetical protein